MKTKTDEFTKEPEKTKRGTKKEAAEALNRLMEWHTTLIAAQRQANREIPREYIVARDRARLKIYDYYYKKIFDATLDLAGFFSLKQAGGRPINEHFSPAYSLMKERYISTGRVMSAKLLASEMRKKLKSEGYKLKSERDIFSYKTALGVRFLFNASLPYEDFSKK